jgi:ribosomal protein S18 acetylase RimI-like enzyme
VADAAAALLSEPALAGWLVSTDDPNLAARLTKVGASPKRLAHLMQCDLRRHPGETTLAWRQVPLPTEADPRLWQRILPSWRAAFPEDHPDHFTGDDAKAIDFILRLVTGREMGPMHRSTTMLVDEDGCVVAGLLVNIRPEEPPWGGPWISDIWRDPRLRGTGVGQQLMDHAKRELLEDDQVSLTLSVTAGNPARRSYERAGFATISEVQTLLLPAERHRSRSS